MDQWTNLAASLPTMVASLQLGCGDGGPAGGGPPPQALPRRPHHLQVRCHGMAWHGMPPPAPPLRWTMIHPHLQEDRCYPCPCPLLLPLPGPRRPAVAGRGWQGEWSEARSPVVSPCTQASSLTPLQACLAEKLTRWQGQVSFLRNLPQTLFETVNKFVANNH